MRFNRLQIPAFGPFTDLDLEFPAQGGDLQLIYGSNEAGKSSLLRSFRDLLFGIHGQSPDNFLHDYKDLRIKGEISNRAGEKLSFQRRKGNKNTLLDGDGQPLVDHALQPFLGSVDQGYFSAMFGLGTRELREGAEQLLRGEGDIGKALFSASLGGGTPVQEVLATLTEESDRLFKGRSTANVSIRPAAGKYKELLRQSREAAVNPEAWEKIERELTTAETHKSEIEEIIHGFTRELEWICRCEDALPSVGRLSEERRKLALLPALPEVSSDFVARARAARNAAHNGRAELQRLTTHIAGLESQLAKCRISPGLLAEAETLDRLHQELSVYGARKNTLFDLETEVAGREALLRAAMRNLELSGELAELERLRLSSAVRLSCEEAAEELQKAVGEGKKHQEKTEELQARIASRQKQLQALPETDLTALREVLSAAAGATSANKTLAAGEAEVKRLRQETKDHHKELIGAPEDLDETVNFSVPLKATIRRFGEEMEEIKRQQRVEEARIDEGQKQIEAIQAELGRLERRGLLPSEQALRKARAHRDHGWTLVLAAWKGSGGQEELMPNTPLEDAFPDAIIQADKLADQLREQAEAVAQAEEKRFQITNCEKQNREAEKKRTALLEQAKACRSAWEVVWLPCRITPQAPREMEEWREIWERFRSLLRQLRTAEESFRKKSSQVQEAKRQLAAALGESADKEFELLFEKARRRIQQGEEATGRRIEITEQLQTLKSELETFHRNSKRVSTAGEAAAAKWQAQCRVIGLPTDISPHAGLALLRQRAELLANFDAWKKLSTEARKTTEAVQQYDQLVLHHCHLQGIKGDSTEARVAHLWETLTQAREARIRREQLSGQIEEARNGLSDIAESSARADQELEELVRQAHLETAEALEPLLANLELRDQVQGRINTFRDTLSGLARGQTVETFIDRLKAEDIDTLSQRKGAIQREKQNKETELQAIRESLYGLNGERQRLAAAGDEAANYRQQAESLAAGLRRDGTRFVRLRLAAHFLQTQIERFRKENQGPLLEKSGKLFQSITQGAFAGLGAEFNADDVPLLVGLRPNQAAVPIEGMSDGSRDQLYLALRLAALDRYLEQHEPMPLILDDLLITFDDDRTTAILPQLAALAQRTQVFLFTHHDHLLELCRRTLGAGSFHLHKLNNNATGKGR